MHDKKTQPAEPETPREDDAVRLVSLLVSVAQNVALDFARMGQEASADDKAAFARSYDDLMTVSRLVDAGGADTTDTKPLPQSNLPD